MKWTKEKRDALNSDSFGDPTRRLFPVEDQDDLEHAARLVGKASDPDAVRKRLIAIAKRKGLKLPESWQESAEHSAETAGLCSFAEFDLVGGTPGGAFVEREAKVLFRAGPYEFKRLGKTFEMTPEDILACVHDFKPVPIDDNHRQKTRPDGTPAPPSYLDKKIGGFGEVTALTPNEQFTEFGCKVKLHPVIDRLHRDAAGKPLPIPLSANFDWDTKRLTDVAMTDNPRISDAALEAAFAAEEEAKMEPSAPHKKLMQFTHDHMAMHGATCSDADGAKFCVEVSAATLRELETLLGSAEFAAGERDAVQMIHDLTLGSGAACSVYKAGMGKNKAWQPGQYYQTAVNQMPAYKEYRPGQYASMSAEPPAPKTARERELERRVERAEAQVRTAEDRRIAAEAATFAAEAAGELTPFVETKAAELFQVLSRDDLDRGGQAEFSREGKQVKAPRVQLLKELLSAVGELPLTKEVVVTDGQHAALFAQETAETDDDRERREAAAKAEKYAEEQNRLGGRTPMKRG